MFFFINLELKKSWQKNMFDAITDAIADLHEDYREMLKIVMRYQDYKNIIKVLANGSATLYTAQPEQVLGKPVVFCDLLPVRSLAISITLILTIT
ncbi:hypothetical protein P7H21_25220 [Paenibacillus larvae]|nr:hypothetical protein [Paenibacillus larvae]